MHPILSNRAHLGLYLLSWLPIGLVLVYWPVTTGALNWWESLAVIFPPLVIYAFLCLSPWYLCQILPLNRTAGYRLVGNHFAAASTVAALWVLTFVAHTNTLSKSFASMDSVATRFRNLWAPFYFIGILLYLLSVALHYLLASVETSQKAQTLARESELKALKMQINPHFLFNSLNSISALTTVDGARARQMCIKLSEFLRSTLNLGDRESIPLSEELSLARTYLEVEQIRFGKRLQVVQEIDDGCGACVVPALIVQPLVENAIKHGISGMLEGGTVRLEVHCEGGNLRVRVTNPFDPESPSPRRNGIGLSNIRQRLSARYGDAARLSIGSTEALYLAELWLPCAAHKQPVQQPASKTETIATA
jgi:two-component system, LytTR family, sensor histidine kinase AlgZ